MVCTRLPQPARPGARPARSGTVTAATSAVTRAGPPAAQRRHRDGHAGVNQRLLADLVLLLEACGLAVQLVNAGPGQEPARPAEDGQAGRDVAGPADRDGAAARLVRAAGGDPGAAGLHPGPHPAGPGADPAAGSGWKSCWKAR